MGLEVLYRISFDSDRIGWQFQSEIHENGRQFSSAFQLKT